MLKKILPLISLSFINPLLGKTTPEVYGYITSDTTWQDTVEVIGDVVVEKRTTLTLKPGTYVKFSGTSIWDTSNGYNGVCDILVFGKIILRGTKQDGITFTSIDTLSRWGSLHFISSIADTIEYLRLSNGIKGIQIDSALSMRIRNCRIMNFKGRDDDYEGEYAFGMDCRGDSIFIKECKIENIQGGSPVYKGTGGAGIGINAVYIKHLEILSNKISNCVGGDGEGHGHHQIPNYGGAGKGLLVGKCNEVIIKQNSIWNCRGGNPRFPTDGSGIGIGSCESAKIHENNIYACEYNLCNSSTTDTVDARYNYWGTIEELEIFNKLWGAIRYSPWTNSTHTNLYYPKFRKFFEKRKNLANFICSNGDFIHKLND